MGMFDNFYYEPKFPGREFQTKDTPSQGLDKYFIDENGLLMYDDYDARWVEDPDALFGGYIDQYNHRVIFCHDFTGEIRFYDYRNEYRLLDEYSAYFVKGKMENFQIIHEGKQL